ncbi:MAG: phosphatidate cytidylyltransferase [Lachnospiraceae bacterium]|nr:phosphatidate cytidylyltransferase [Lachnospiraceae bacterium]MDO4451763.1 phosphatidate cytidylyltransferase [Lachnospiraceae bacterium]
MFKTRLLSGIVLVIIALITVITGQDVLFGVLLVISLIGMSELYKVVDVHKKLLGFTGYLAGILYYACIRFGSGEQLIPLIIGFLVLLMAVYVFSFPKYVAQQVMFVFFGLFYVAMMLSYVYQTRMLPQGAFLVWLIFLCSWGSDTCAYCVGMLIGKHKMAPKLSPKKSVEGGIGGILGAALLGAIYALAINKFAAGADANVLRYAVICGVGSMISQVGDLAASAIKRNHDIKDYGKLIPGHGGILDRFDSVIFTAPIIYYLSVMFMK